MTWLDKSSSFKYNGLRVTRESFTCATPMGEFKVYESVGGKCFHEYPYIGLEDRGSGIATPAMKMGRLPCRGVEHGKQLCEAHWKSLKAKMDEV